MKNIKSTNAINILLVEDNEGDIILTLEALSEVGLDKYVSVVRDGEQAMKFLKKCISDSTQSFPNMILLDINLPKVDGKQVLTFIKSTEELRHIPVIMLTTSNAQNDINESYSNYANCYITKPVDLETFFGLIQCIQTHWIELVKLPTN